MRLLTRKIYRAFPELDQFDDETCLRYMIRAGETRGHTTRVALLMVVVLIGFVIAGLIASPQYHLLMFIAHSIQGNRISPMLETSIEFTSAMNFIWIPWMSALVARDRLLERLLRRHLQGVECPMCTYNLIGLDIYEKSGYKLVRCPECGKEVILADNNLIEEDINPNHASS